MDIQISDFEKGVREELDSLLRRDGISFKLVVVKLVEARLKDVRDAAPGDYGPRLNLFEDLFPPRG